MKRLVMMLATALLLGCSQMESMARRNQQYIYHVAAYDQRCEKAFDHRCKGYPGGGGPAWAGVDIHTHVSSCYCGNPTQAQQSTGLIF
jgi:hypothetical protein